jgi:hypothetical protein
VIKLRVSTLREQIRVLEQGSPPYHNILDDWMIGFLRSTTSKDA